MCANFKSDHRQELLQAVRQDVHTIQLMCLDGTITASGLLLATISPLIRVSFFEWSDEVRAKREPSSRNEYIK